MRLAGTLILACVAVVLTLGTTGCSKKEPADAKAADGAKADDNRAADDKRKGKEAPPIAANEGKIRGKWLATKGEMPAGSTLELAPDNTMKLTVKAKDKEKSLAGTYKVEGDKLTLTYKPGG